MPIYTIFDFRDVLLEALQKSTNETTELFPVCDHVLEYTYLQRDEIYKQFFWMATGRWDHSREERYLSVNFQSMMPKHMFTPNYEV